jgi:hypothetical protein
MQRLCRPALGVLVVALTLTACGSTVATRGTIAGAESGDGRGTSSTGGLGTVGTTGGSPVAGGGTDGSSNAAGAPGTAGAASSGATGSAGSSGVGSASLGAATAGGVGAKRPIEVGITYSKDASAGLQAIGVSAGTFGNQKHYGQIVVDDANKHGGFGGRKIVPVFFAIDPNPGAAPLPQQEESACATFTQDNHVEVVFAQLVGETLLSCLQKHGVPAVGEGYLSGFSASYYRATPLMYQVGGINLDRRAGFEVDALVRQKYFSGWDTTTGAPGALPVKVGIITYDIPDWVASAKGSLSDAVVRAGFARPEVVAVAPHDSYSNLSTAQSQIQSAVLSFKAKGITHVIICDDNGIATLFFTTNAEDQHYRPRYGVNSGNNMKLMASGTAPKAQLNGALGMGWNPIADLDTGHSAKFPNAGRAKCNALMQQNGESGTGYNEGFAVPYCSTANLLKAISDRLGNPTAATLAQGLDAVGGSFQPLLTPAAYLAPGHHDGLGGIWDYGYDNSCSCMTYRGGVRLLPRTS